METKTPNTKQEQDSAYNPGERHADEEFNQITHNYKSTADELKDLEDYANAGHSTDEIENYANGSKVRAINNAKNVETAKQKEEEGTGWKNNFSGAKPKKDPFSFKDLFKPANLKKRGPMATIVIMLLGGGGFLGTFVAPGLGIIQMKEAFMKDLNDQLAATDITTDHLFKSKLKGLQAGASICGNVVSIRCKFGTMSKKQVAKFKEAGFIIEPEGDGRIKPTSITFPDDDQGNPGKRITNPNELSDHLRGNPAAQSQIRRAFNPKFAGITDKIANAVLLKMKIDKTSKIPSTDKVEDQEKAITQASEGTKGKISPEGYETDKDGKKYVVDEHGNKIYEDKDPGKFKELSDANLELRSKINEEIAGAAPGAGAISKFFSNVGRGLRLTGSLDTACTVYNTARAVAALAKTARTLQEAQWAASMIMTPADMTKDAAATQEITTFVGNKLTATDNNKTIKDNTTIKGVDNNGNLTYEEKPNPDYGKTAFDARGYKLAAYNNPLDASSPLTAREQQFTAGGGLTGNLSGVLDTITSTLGLGNNKDGRKAIRGTCGVIQSWWVRSIGLVAGLVSAVGSFGATTALSIGASVAIGFAMPFLQAAMGDMLAGTVASGKTKSVDAGNVGFVGSSHMLGKMAAGRGLKPSNLKTQKDYELVGKEVQDSYVASETYEARKTPFDIKNQYSFLGSIMWKINPTILKSSASVSGALVSIPSILGTAVTSILPVANAAEVFNEERFKQCQDQGYFELDINADVFCNVRYIETNKQLAMDPDAAAIYMETNGHIEADGAAKSDAYKKWIKYCTERDDGFGETSSDEPEDYDAETGKICMEESEQNDNFVVFTISKTVQDAMDSDPDSNSSAWYSPTSIGSVNMEPSL